MSTPGAALPSDPSENAGPRILAATLVTTCLAVVTVIARLLVRRFMIKAIGWDDAVMLLALLLSVSGEVFVVLQVLNGGGRHLGDIEPDVAKRGLYFNFIGQPIYFWAICIVKMSVGLSLLRIATERKWRVAIQSIMGFMFFYTLLSFITILLQCKDLATLWDASVPRRCWSLSTLQGLSYTNVTLNILTDFIFAIVIPIPMLWSLQMGTRMKASVMAILSLGLFACIAAIVKIPSLVNYGKTGDFLWDSREMTIWTVTECNVGIIAGSLPTLKPVFKPILGSSYVRSLTRRYGRSTDRQLSSQNRYRASKAFSSLNSKAATDRHIEFEARSQSSQKNLVDNDVMPLGVIEKTIDSTFTVIGRDASYSSPSPEPWANRYLR